MIFRSDILNFPNNVGDRGEGDRKGSGLAQDSENISQSW